MSRLLETIAAAFQPAFDAFEPGAPPTVRRSEHADLQVNGVLALAKRRSMPPRDLASQILAQVDLEGICDQVEIAGGGFVNLTLSPAYLAEELASIATDLRLGVAPAVRQRTAVVDYASPNVAKEMAVHHLRSTIIGDAIVRMLDFVGHRVIRENHIGDWGTPFGMLIEYLCDVGEEQAVEELALGDLEAFYRQARAAFDADPEFKERSRRRVVALQSGDKETLRLWGILVEQSVRHFSEIFSRLGVLLTPDDVVGESFYNASLPQIVSDLDAAGLLVESDGARCVFPPGFTNRDGEPLPLIVQKSDGGYNYAATDLASVRDRVGREGADLLVYVVGAPQAQHLEMVFAVSRLAGWLPSDVEAVHVGFGNVLGQDRKMFRTRSGDTVKLIDLLDEAIERAAAIVREKSPNLAAADAAKVAQMVGIGAVKYADLSNERQRDYVFDWDRMLSFDGNTAPYLQYAHARICSIFRRAEPPLDPEATSIDFAPFGEKEERALAVMLTSFDDAVNGALATWSPHRLCTYLYELAGTFTSFYEHCPVLRAPDEVTRQSRLALCALTRPCALASGLGLLGIDAPGPHVMASEAPICAHLLSKTASIGGDGHLSVAGVDLLELAETFGTPLFVYDEEHLRARCKEAVQSFGTGVAYATKAFLCKAMASLAHEEGMMLDVATGGEFAVALAAGVPASSIIFHGNNKSEQELESAVEASVRHIVIDSFDEIDRLAGICKGLAPTAAQRVYVRVTPGVVAHTHEFVKTGQEDSKFGFSVASGAAQRAIDALGQIEGVTLVGLHAHIGSQIFLLDAFEQEVAALAPLLFANGLSELCIGGGLGSAYLNEEESSSIADWAATVHRACAAAGIGAGVEISAEPGRSIVATAGLTCYRVGTIKDLPGIRTYVSVDGGMSDNPRPVLYGSGYEAFLARAADARRPRAARIVGKHCESGDIVVADARLPVDLAIGDVLVTPVTGAYGHAMASNYNRVARPPVVFVRDGEARVVVRRETVDDLLRLEP